MNRDHRALCAADGVQGYRNRAYISHHLDDAVFDALNHDGHVNGVQGYCLDAPDLIPAGAMICTPCPAGQRRHAYSRPTQIQCERGATLAETRERERALAELIADILARNATADTGVTQ